MLPSQKGYSGMLNPPTTPSYFFLFLIKAPGDSHLLIILSEGRAHGIFVDCLHNTDDLSIAVADGHAEDGLGLIAG